WNQVNPKLPARKIEVLGPPPTSGTRDSFVELVMDFGCRDFAEIKALPDARARSQACGAIREDGAFIEAGENDNLIVQKLATTPDAMGIFGFSFYDQNRDKVKAHTIEGVKDEIEEISSGRYPVARDMYFYVKGQHIGVIPGLKEFVAEYVSEKAFGKDGYLGDKGLIPLPDAERKKVRDAALAAAPLTM
ncbi:MAG: substrate-binding domain-containing protein, partial [Elsteraceae bacterium]